jgi:ApbE superfamily uncharacterized protein (UPF0280 family)
MAAAVADELICGFRDESEVTRAYINNGGDIALHLRAGRMKSWWPSRSPIQAGR